MRLTPYLLFDGDCEQAFKFYETVFQGRIQTMVPHEGTPAADHVPPHWRAKILHAQIEIGDQVLMGSDAPPDRFATPKGFSVSIACDTVAESERLFAALSTGGVVKMPLQQTFWAERFGMCVDRFGTPWMINCEAAA